MKQIYNLSYYVASLAATVVGVILFLIYVALGGIIGDLVSVFVAILCATCGFLLCFGGRKIMILEMERKLDASMGLFQMMDYNERRYNREL